MKPSKYNYKDGSLPRSVLKNIFTPVSTDNYKEIISYDANGNIQTYLRNGTTEGGSPLAMDNMTYHYKPNTNQLDHVTDAVPASNYSIDIDNQNVLNYSYDQIGNLTKDEAEGITAIKWNVYGKITDISKSDGTKINYTYDPAGNRTSKTVNNKKTFYVRDASGNVMSVYTKDAGVNGGDLSRTETHLYGSSRLGMSTQITNVENPTATHGFETGFKIYEGVNHLGNVLVTISDKKIGVDANSDGIIDYYTANVITANGFYPFGAIMPGRNYNAGSYRYGFNGKENDNEVKGEGNQQDYGMRIYDPRLGRFLSVDPLTKQYPHYTPYSFAGNKPTVFIDLDGAEECSADAAMMRDDKAYLEGKMTAEKRRDNQVARGMGALLGVAVIVDAYVTKGKISQFLLTSQILGHLYHNGTNNPVEQQKREDDLKNDFIGLAGGYILGKGISILAKTFTTSGKAIFKEVSSKSIRYSQSSVNDLDEIIVSMQKNGWKGDPIDIVKMKDNIYTTADNTRLLAAELTGTEIQATAHNYDDLIPAERAKYFLNKKGEAPTTWGEAIENRINNQNAQFRKNADGKGSFNVPKKGSGKKTGTGG